MKRIFLTIGACLLALIPITSFLLMWELIDFPYHYMGYFVVAYLSLVLVLLARELLLDLWRWLAGR